MTDTAAGMSPDASPGAVSKTAGVRRVNNLPMYLLLGVVALFLIVMALVAADRAEKQNTPAEAKIETAGSTATFANEIAGNQTDGMIGAAHALSVPDVPAAPAPEPVLIARPDLNEPPAPPSGGQLDQPAVDPEAERIRQAKAQLFEEAIKAKTTVQATAPRSAGAATGEPQSREEMLARLVAARQQIDAQRADNPTAAYQARLAQLRGAGGGGSQAAAAPSLVQTSGGDYARFADGSEGDRWRLDSKTQAPRTPFELRAGSVMPATLISGVNSDLPGQIVAQVSQDVYDTPTGMHVLVPQGSRLVGAYSSDVAYGQSRVLIAWQRIVFPDGKALDIGSMPGADSAGYSGFRDQVNNHYFRLFASAILMSGVTAGIAISQDDDSESDRPTASSAMSEALGQQLGLVTAQLIAKNMNIAPTLEIRPGYRFNVVATKDLTFNKPYQSFDY